MKIVLLGLIFGIIPLFCLVFTVLGYDKRLGKSVREIIVVTVGINMFTGGIGFFFSMWSKYELLLFHAICSILFAMIIWPLIKKKTVSNIQILVMVSFISVAIACYSALTYGQTVIHSDIATATSLLRSQFRHHSFFPVTWNYANGDIWVLNVHIFIMPFYLLLHNQSLVRMCGSVLYFLVTIIAMFLFSKKIFSDQSWVLSIPVFGICLSGSADMILYQAAYLPLCLFSVISCAFIYKIYNQKNRKYLISFFILMIFLNVGGIRFVAENSIPLGLTFFVLIYLEVREKERVDWKKNGQKLIYMLAVIFIPTIIGFGIYLQLCKNHNMNNTINNATVFVNTISDCWNNLVIYITRMFENFGFVGNAELFSIEGFRNMVSVVLCLIIIFIVPVLQLRKFKYEREPVQFYFVFGIIHNLIMMILVVMFGKTERRYLLSSVYIFVLISCRYIMAYWIGQENFRKYIWTFLFLLTAGIQGVSLVMESEGWKDKLAQKKNFAETLVNHGLEKGYASYWNAYTNEIYSDLRLRFGGVNFTEAGVVPYLWLVDSDVFKVEDTDTFLLLNEEENERIGSSIPLIYGEPKEFFQIENMYVYVFDYDILIKFSGEG